MSTDATPIFRTIGWVVDAQNDFLCPPSEGGRLYVHDLAHPERPGSARIIPRLAATVAALRETADLVVFTGDWHGMEDAEIDAIAPNPVQGTYPPHCMGRSADPEEVRGAELHSSVAPTHGFVAVLPWNATEQELTQACADLVTTAGYVRHTRARGLRALAPTLFVQKTQFAVFTGNPQIRGLLSALPTGDSPSVIVCGVATDVCVTQAIEGFQEHLSAWRLTVVRDAIAGLGLEADESCIARWVASGVAMLDTMRTNTDRAAPRPLGLLLATAITLLTGPTSLPAQAPVTRGCESTAETVALQVESAPEAGAPRVELRRPGTTPEAQLVANTGCVRIARTALTPDSRLLISQPGYRPQEIDGVALLAHSGTYLVTLSPRDVMPVIELPELTSVATRGGPDMPITATTVTGEALRGSLPGQELPVLLGALPGVVAHSDAGLGMGYAYFRVRGMDQTRVNVTLDGVPMTEPEDQGFYSMNLVGLAGGLASAQLQRGVGTTSAGTASYAGALSLETPSLRAMRPEAHLTLRAGSFGMQQAALRWTGAPEGGTGWRASVGLTRQAFDGFRRESGNRSGSIMATGGHVGERLEVKGLLMVGEQRNDMAYVPADEATLSADLRANPLTPEEDDQFGQRLAAITLTSVPTGTSRWSLTVYGGGLDGQFDVRADSTSLLNFALASQRLGTLAAYTTEQGSWFLVTGLNLDLYHRDHSMTIRQDDGGPASAPLYLNRGNKDGASAFAKLRVRWGPASVLAEVAARNTRFRYTPDAAAGIDPMERGWTFLDPKVGLLWPLSMGRHAYVSLGETRREPTRSDLFAGFDNVDSSNIAFVGSLDRVRHERVRDLEVGVRHSSSTSAWGGNLFWMSFRDEIAPIGQLSVLGLPLRKNVAASRRLGAEFEGRWQSAAAPRPGQPVLRADGTLSLLHSRIAAYTDDATGETYRGTPLAGSPPVISTQALELQWASGASVRLRGRYLAPAGLDNAGRKDLRTPASYVVHLGAEIDRGPWAVDLLVGNILNARIFPAGLTDGTTRFFYPEATRHLMLSVRRDLGGPPAPRRGS